MSKMKTGTTRPKKLSRRTFLRLIGFGFSGGILAACGLLPDPEADTPYLDALASPLPPSGEQAATPAAETTEEAVADADLTRFLQLSAVLTGFSDLNPQLARTYIQSIEADSSISASLSDLYDSAGVTPDAPVESLQALQERGLFEDDALNSLANTIIKHWYTGTYSDGDSTKVATYVDSLAWRSLDFTKTRSLCASPRFWEANPRVVPQQY